MNQCTINRTELVKLFYYKNNTPYHNQMHFYHTNCFNNNRIYIKTQQFTNELNNIHDNNHFNVINNDIQTCRSDFFLKKSTAMVIKIIKMNMNQ